jgi:hypothetical protein
LRLHQQVSRVDGNCIFGIETSRFKDVASTRFLI